MVLTSLSLEWDSSPQHIERKPFLSTNTSLSSHKLWHLHTHVIHQSLDNLADGASFSIRNLRTTYHLPFTSSHRQRLLIMLQRRHVLPQSRVQLSARNILMKRPFHTYFLHQRATIPHLELLQEPQQNLADFLTLHRALAVKRLPRLRSSR